jgi:DNA-binding MarR family transcriptional regulator
MMEKPCKVDHKKFEELLHQRAMELFEVEDATVFELFGKIQRVAQLCEILDYAQGDEITLSGPRWRIMLRLMIDEKIGVTEGVTPTMLSHSQRVSKNTISALLRGLEEQELIKRNLDPDDLRVFRIQLTDKGRDLIRKSAPDRIESLNRMFSTLTQDEKKQLLDLLEKLHQSLISQVRSSQCIDELHPPLKEQ